MEGIEILYYIVSINDVFYAMTLEGNVQASMVYRERDCLLAHGASRFLWEKLFVCSDEFYTWVCNKCGLIATVNEEKQEACCNPCKNYMDFSKVAIPYACKLFFMELESMGIVPRIEF